MKLVRLKINDDFRSLKKGFVIDYRNAETSKELSAFRPFCFVGLNGSGKSNVLEALSSIFFHLERCYRNYQPKSFKEYFDKAVCNPNAFELEYYFNLDIASPKSGGTVGSHIKVVKESNKEPVFYKKDKATEIAFTENHIIHTNEVIIEYLPEFLVGYSSGENEILSLPFFKTRYIHYDEYIETLRNNEEYVKPESSLVYIDASMSQAVLLANFLMQKKEVLQPFKDKLNIEDIFEFRIVIKSDIYEKLNEKGIQTISAEEKRKEEEKPENQRYLKNITSNIESTVIDKLKRCSTCWYQDNETHEIYFDYKIDIQKESEVKKAFVQNFVTVFDLYRAFQILQTLNLHDTIKDTGNIYKSESLYINEEIPTNSILERVFRIENFKIKKTNIPYPIDTKSLSDGEHQFLHTMGISIMAKDKNALFLLDEPETHFNPDWRSHFMSTMKNCLEADGGNHLLNDLIITTHSPFIVSDCYQDYVRIFTQYKGCKKPDFKTFGASVNFINVSVFNKNETISVLAENIINQLRKDYKSGVSAKKIIEKAYEELADSVERMLFINEIIENEEKK